jgi:hypothetical protein
MLSCTGLRKVIIPVTFSHASRPFLASPNAVMFDLLDIPSAVPHANPGPAAGAKRFEKTSALLVATPVTSCVESLGGN